VSVGPRRALIGVLGGMGPAATIDFLSKIMRATPASSDQEHVPLIVHDVPQIADRSTAILSGSDAPWPGLLAGVQRLERSNVTLIAIPCNAAHFWHERLSRATSVRVAHIADAVRLQIQGRGRRISRLALMAARGTIAADVYGRRLDGLVDELMVPAPAVQDLIERSIRAVKAGAPATALAAEAAERLLHTGADELLLACTELPIAMAGTPSETRCIDPTDALARLCVRASLDESLW
jgi:aspartate racemase